MAPPGIRIPRLLTIIVVVTGIIAFIRIRTRADARTKPFPTTYFIIWIIACIILIGITYWSWHTFH